jgi:Secretion system C-terminal sorting domain
MKTLSLLLIQVLGVAVCNAQYLYFSTIPYENSWDTGYAYIHSVELNSFYYVQAVGIEDGLDTKSNIKLDQQGEISEIFSIPNQWGDDRTIRRNILFQNDSTYILCPNRGGSCLNQMPHMYCLTLENEILWEKDFAEWEDCDQELFINPRKLLRISDTSFMFITLLRPYQQNPPSQFRFTEINFEGEIISDHISTSSLWAYFNLNEVHRYGDNYILLGSDVNCGDYDINIIKTDLQGNILSDTCIGNPNDCPDGSAGTYVNPDGTMQLVYARCLENFSVFEQTHEMRSIKLNIDDWSLVYDYSIPFSIFDEGLLSSSIGFDDFVLDPDGGYAGVFYYYSPQASILAEACVLKIQPDGTLDWINLYQPPNAFGNAQFMDIEATSDGGFIVVGSTWDFAPEAVERGWALKIDNCGYEEPNGCPPVVSVAEQAKPNIQVWPNPFHAQLKAVLPPNANRVFISDATGRIVFEEKVFYPNQTWNLSALSDGVYVLSVAMESGQVISERIVKR